MVSLAVGSSLGFVGVPLAIAGGLLVYLDSRKRGREQGIAALLGFIIAGLFLAGTVPAFVALAVSAAPTDQGFPTAIRIVPGVVALLVYLRFR